MLRKLSSEDVSGSASESPARRRGPKPLLSAEQEVQLVQWVLARQRAGRRVSRDDVISQAQQFSLRDKEEAKASHPLGLGWCNRFIARYPELNLRCGGQPGAKTEVPVTTKEENLYLTNEDGVLSEALEDLGQHVEHDPENVLFVECLVSHDHANLAPSGVVLVEGGHSNSKVWLLFSNHQRVLHVLPLCTKTIQKIYKK
jgi:hypothetical protein